MAGSVVGNTIKKGFNTVILHQFVLKGVNFENSGHFEFENIQNNFLGLINMEINALYETLCQIIGSYAL